MKKKWLLGTAAILAFALFALTPGCKKAEDATSAQAETTTTTTEGTETTVQTETERVGENVQTTTETSTEGPGPDADAKMTTWTGTVTELKAGDSIEILTVDNDKKSFDLNDKDWAISVDPAIQVGSRVKVVEDRTEARKALTITKEM